MEKLKRFLRNWLGFSRTEVNGFIILLPILLMIIFSEPVYRSWVSGQDDDFSLEAKLLDSLVARLNNDDQLKVEEKQFIKETKNSVVFEFDPNKISEKDFVALGFSERLSNRIAHYRQKGGVFRIKADMMKIYGMDSTLYHQLFSYIQLPERVDKKKNDVKIPNKLNKKSSVEFDINKADSAQLKIVYGIGPALALRIIKFRDGLGGFVDAHQLNEVYGLDSIVVNRLNKISYIEEDFEPQKLNLNSADEKILSSHPYVRKPLAKAILSYRFQHGAFTDLNDLRKIALLTPHEIDRLIPYLKVKD